MCLITVLLMFVWSDVVVCLVLTSVYLSYYLVCCLLSLMFFFQAEDGIRDIGVTGVQTCALPISPTPIGMPIRLARPMMISDPMIACATPPPGCPSAGGDWVKNAGSRAGSPRKMRSEERRVGKECRSRWSPYH